jgi:acetyl-CoA carboxylase biotin carboxyl carrier protein
VAPVAVEEDSKFITIKSPIMTFYRKPSPDKAMFVSKGHIGKGDVLCVIEAMKLFNEISLRVSGKIVKSWLTIYSC